MFAATKRIAKLLSEEGFALIHQGKKDNIQLSLVGQRTMPWVIFEDRTTSGMARLGSRRISSGPAEVVSDIAARKFECEKISQEFRETARGTLDDLFGSL